jgi:hypothetical protein
MHENEIGRGMALLDAVRPGWENEVDTDRLVLNRCDKCVIGQLYVDPRGEKLAHVQFWAKLQELNVVEDLIDGGGTLVEAQRYGFALDTASMWRDDESYAAYDRQVHIAYATLTREWQAAIAARRYETARAVQDVALSEELEVLAVSYGTRVTA